MEQILKRKDIVLVPFPFSNQAESKKRPALIVSNDGFNEKSADVIACAITSNIDADYSVYINNSQEFDGSDAGALPDEAVSWGKILPEAESVKVFGDATILFPLLVAQTFAK